MKLVLVRIRFLPSQLLLARFPMRQLISLCFPIMLETSMCRGLPPKQMVAPFLLTMSLNTKKMVVHGRSMFMKHQLKHQQLWRTSPWAPSTWCASRQSTLLVQENLSPQQPLWFHAPHRLHPPMSLAFQETNLLISHGRLHKTMVQTFPIT